MHQITHNYPADREIYHPKNYLLKDIMSYQRVVDCKENRDGTYALTETQFAQIENDFLIRASMNPDFIDLGDLYQFL